MGQRKTNICLLSLVTKVYCTKEKEMTKFGNFVNVSCKNKLSRDSREYKVNEKGIDRSRSSLENYIYSPASSRKFKISAFEVIL
ncbi:hypothetical protein WN51_14461 [Melipona quadrifasciata]|uniref:Uncharacterized protein n=1 Tax=Melipona quadrifasciata TaxID=166423 RepID=A0A0M8ZY07_9HYME|nr:hypothetical protein WN51_14461 [Melipona quadrifasciata]